MRSRDYDAVMIPFIGGDRSRDYDAIIIPFIGRDRLYMLEREKEKLMEQVDAANKAMINMSGVGKKYEDLFFHSCMLRCK